MTLYHAHYWVVVLHPRTVAIRSLDSVPIIMLVHYFVTPPSITTCRHSRGITSSSPIDSSLSKYSAATLLFALPKSRPTFFHHRQDTLAPGLQVDRSQRSRIGRLAIYYATVFYLLVIYFPIPSKTASTIASSNCGHYLFPPPCLLGCLPVRRCATLCWKLPRSRSILGIITHFSAPNNNTACVTDLKKNP